MIYIQSDSERKLPHNFDAACVLYGAIENAEDVRLTSIDEILSGKFDSLIRNRLMAGSVDFMQAVFNRAGIIVPSIHTLNQNYTETSLSEVRSKIQSGEEWFIKPLSAKLFTGMVFNATTISQLKASADDMKVLISKPFESRILNEVRCYVHNNVIVDARNYAGDFRITHDWSWADRMVKDMKDAPIAYTMDIAAFENGENTIVEFNDMWAIGNYGIDNSTYFQLLKARYFEIMAAG